FGAERVVDTPLSEGAIVGASLGLAWAGMVPVAEIQFLGFTHQAFHQVAGQLARIRARSGGRHGCQATLRAPFGGGVRAPELHTLVPLDVEAIVAAAERTGRVVVAQEAPPTAGFASEVVATVQEEAFYALEAPIARVSGFDTPYPPAMLEERWVPDVSRVAAAVRRTLEARA